MEMNVSAEREASFTQPPSFNILIADEPIKMKCHYCHADIETEVEFQIGSQSLAMCGFTMPCLVCWIPLVMNRFKDAKHSCPQCKEHMGMFIRF
jgi:lipopolysaccharide-induced tumor necrosis factor-alpha factor